MTVGSLSRRHDDTPDPTDTLPTLSPLPEPSPVSNPPSPLPCLRPCLSQVKARLHTLEHVYDNSHLVLSTEQVKRLWACLGPGGPVASMSTPAPSPSADGAGMVSAVAATVAAAAATVGEVSTLLSWLSKACEACEAEGGGGMFEKGVAAELFTVGGAEEVVGG